MNLVVTDVQTVVRLFEALGLHLNCRVCTLVAFKYTVIMNPTLQSLGRMEIEDTMLHWVPLFTDQMLA